MYILEDNGELYHYGTPRHSGRYPWGSGEDPYQHEGWMIISENKRLKDAGYTEAERAAEIGKKLDRKMTTTQLRAEISIANSQIKAYDRSRALALKDKGYSNVKIGQMMGRNESSIRDLLDPAMAKRASKNEQIADILRDQVEKKKYLDITSGVEYQFGELTDEKGVRIGADQALNVTATSLKTAVAILEKQGYKKSYIKVEQAGNPGNFTTVKVLTKDDVPWKEIHDNRDKIMAPGGVYIETGNTVRHIKPPVSISSDRVAICYAEDGGAAKDGVIELRRGATDLSMGANQYAQVRIAVDDTHYLKGMAIYSDNLPPGVDIRFNTNKHSDTPKMKVLKPLKEDPDNPFGATIRQIDYIDEKGNKKQSPINIVNDDSDWGHWSRTLSSQVLSKQSPQLAKRQLGITYSNKKQEFDDICALTNPAIKRRLLESFADSCDSDSVHLKAAAMPRQETKVILPLTKIKDNEIYAPTFKNGEQVALIRYPHGGTFEIPVLTVNNHNQEGNSVLKQAPNAVGINANVAARLSGADFDGDTVTVIPLAGQNFKTTKPLEGLKNFDPSEQYPAYEGMPKVIDGVNFHKQMEMGKVSNLITDMTLQGADSSEIARAVRHSMVVIDAEKHQLNWKLSEERNGIKALKEKYQGGKNKGASTLISKASSEYSIPEVKRIDIDPNTGEKVYVYTNRTYSEIKRDKETGEYYETGKIKTAMQSTSKMEGIYAEGGNAFSPAINSGNRMEMVYAEHADKLRALGNAARKEYISTKPMEYNPAAAKTYSKEVASLNAKLNDALKNSPRERQAQLMADKTIKEYISKNPELKDRNHKEELNKIRQQALSESRARAGSISRQSNKLNPDGTPKPSRAIDISDREWEAIQAGAISNTKMEQILKNADLDAIKERATPRENKAVSTSKLNRAKVLYSMGYSQSEIAEACGLSVATLRNQGVF